MKRRTMGILKCLIILLVSLCFINLSFPLKSYENCSAYDLKYFYHFEYGGREYGFSRAEILNETKRSKFQQANSTKDKQALYDRLLKMGFETEEAVRYVFPESEIILKKLQKIIEKNPKAEKVKVVKNACKLQFLAGTKGVFINRQKFYQDFLSQALRNGKNIGFSVETEEYEKDQNLRDLFSEKGCFSTNFSTSNESRKNNIRVALSAFDGLILDEGEILSFNRTTGVRNEDSGYMPAKIITGGTYTLGFGGGVCQVSTTLYNACLLSGLEILEVNSHSLPVSYVEPSFDAMVNVGSSDLVVRNNTNGKIIITTSSVGDVCKVKIFGLKNKYRITRCSEKTKIIPAKDDIVDTDYQKYGIDDLMTGEERRISYKKDGYCSNGYLKFYDQDGVLIETKKIRSNKYNATTGVVVRREE